MNISMIRGDTTPLMFQRKDNNGDVIKLRADKIYFTVKKSDLPDEVLFQKTIDDMTFDEDGTYHYFSNETDANDIEILKDSQDDFISIDTEAEWNEALTLFLNKHKNDIEKTAE